MNGAIRLPYAMDRLPARIDHARLPGIMTSLSPLRLNTEPFPAAFLPSADLGHTGRVTAITGWLQAACGSYAPYRQLFITRYLDFIAAHLENHRDEVLERLWRFDGIYRIEDCLWSALRPLPRAWLPLGNKHAFVDFAFYDGQEIFAVLIGEESLRNEDAIRAAGIAVQRLPVAVIRDAEAIFEQYLPAAAKSFWNEVLPSSPFRRGELDDALVADGQAIEVGVRSSYRA